VLFFGSSAVVFEKGNMMSDYLRRRLQKRKYQKRKVWCLN
jgi:hypothetical protein